MKTRSLFAAFALMASPTAAQYTAPLPTTCSPSGDCIRSTPVVNPDGTTIAAPRESFQLATANTPAAAVTTYGGDYILSQTCTTYGTLILQVLGPDGTTYQTVLTKTASDTTGGTGVALGSYAKVRVQVTGTAGCNALLARVPS